MNCSRVIGEWASTPMCTHPHTLTHKHIFPDPKGRKRDTNGTTAWTLTIGQQSWWSPSLTSVTQLLLFLLLPPRPPLALCDWLFIYFFTLISSLRVATSSLSLFCPLCHPSFFPASPSAWRLSIHLSAPHLSNSLTGLSLSSLRAVIDGGVIVSSSPALKLFLQVSTTSPFKTPREFTVDSEELFLKALKPGIPICFGCFKQSKCAWWDFKLFFKFKTILTSALELYSVILN